MDGEQVSATPDVEESNIHDIVGSYYIVCQTLAELRDNIDNASDIGKQSRANLSSLLDQLGGWKLHNYVHQHTYV